VDEKRDKKIVIIGAGPIGCYTAQVLKTYGYHPILVEEHTQLGRPLHCTGLIGEKVFFEKRPFNIKTSSILNTIDGAVIHYDSQSFVIKREKVAYVVDREKFDKELGSGLNILYKNKFLGIKKDKRSYIVQTDKNHLYADIVIGADGANSSLRKMLNPQANDIKFYKGLQLRIQTKPRHKNFVEVYLKKPSFFWIVPEQEDIVRLGTISENPSQQLKEFLREIKIKGKILNRFGGIVSIGICKYTVKENVAIVGDAACQLKPISYGGIYFGLKSASLLCDCIKEGRLSAYDSLWKQGLGREIKIGLVVRQIYQQLNYDELKKMFELLRSQKDLIEKIGDFENHSKLFLELFKRPQIYPHLASLFKIFLSKIINE